MKRSATLFFYGLGISFTGSLPPGILNTGITGLAVHEGARPAFSFGTGAILVETLLVYLAAAGLKFFNPKRRLYRWLSFLACVIVLSLAIFSLTGKWQMQGQPGGSLYRLPFLAGVFLSALNPLHLPFWLGWSAVLRAKGILGEDRRDRLSFAAAAGLGTALAFLTYGLGGRLFMGWIHVNQGMLNGAISLGLLTAGLLQLRRLGRAILSNNREL